MKKSTSYRDVDLDSLTNALQSAAPPSVAVDGDGADVEAAILEGCRVITEAAASCTSQRSANADHQWDQLHPRWKRLLESNDSKLIWKSINWKGNIENDISEQPSDEQFKEHFENLLNPQSGQYNEHYDVNSPYIPVLDDPFTSDELNQAVKSLNTNKSYVDLCPGII